MNTQIDQIADGIYRISTFVAEMAPPDGFTFNQFLIRADQPLLYDCGSRALFPSVAAAVGRIMPVERLRWISFGHVGADEREAMNLWLEAAPRAEVVYSPLGCDVSVRDLAGKAPRSLPETEVLDLGGKRIRLIPTPHVLQGWTAQLLFEEITRTLFCGELFSHVGKTPAVTAGSVLQAAIAAEDMFGATSVGPATAPTIRRLADLAPLTLAMTHGASFRGNGRAALHALANHYEQRVDACLAAAE